MTQLEYAKNNCLTALMRKIASLEGVASRVILNRIKQGKVVILKNRIHSLKKPCAVGTGLSTKINANLGTSTDKSQLSDELKKLAVAVQYGADAVMDLSVGGDLRKIRREILKRSPVPVGTVPVYELAVNAQQKNGNFLAFDSKDIFEVLEAQAKEGVDFFTIHAGVNRQSLKALKKHRRILDIVSRGGAIIASWMKYHRRENPFFEYFDKILEIAHKYDVTLSLGDGLRPGSVLDATDNAQITELKVLGKLASRARARGVQVMIEGPGHVPINQIEKNVLLEKKICQGAPFYVLGPLVTDIASGYDHINASIGGALAASFGADFLCYVTASEHLRHPSVDDVKDGVIAAKISAHAADLVKRPRLALAWDKEMSQARKKRDWKRQISLSVNPDKAGQFRKFSLPQITDVCTMCGQYCSIKLAEECLRV